MLPLLPEEAIGLGMDSELSDSNQSKVESIQELGICDLKKESIVDNFEIKSVLSNSLKKRVQFLPDGCLVRVREIPPRSETSSSECEGSASESSSSSDDSSSEDTDSEPEDNKADATEQPPSQTIILQTTNLSDGKVKKGAFLCAPTLETKIQTEAVSKPSRSSLQSSAMLGKLKPTTPKRSYQIQKTRKNSEKTEKDKIFLKNSAKLSPTSKKQPSLLDNKSKGNLPAVKNGTNSERKLALIRTKNQQPKKSLVASHKTTIQTSLITLSAKLDIHNEMPEDGVAKMIDSLSVEELYAVDRFLSLPNNTEVRFPELSPNNGRRQSFLASSSQREATNKNGAGIWTQQQQQVGNNQTPSVLPNNNTYYHSWLIPNGNTENPFHSTPCIAQLWDSDLQPYSRETHQVVQSGRTSNNHLKKT